MNLLMNGDKNAISKVKKLYGENFEYTVAGKDGKFELIFETPDGIKVELPNYMKNFTSKEAANKAGKSLINKTKEVINKEEVVATQEGQISYIPISPEGKPIFTVDGKRLVKTAPKSEVDAMIAEGKAIKPGVNLGDVNQSNSSIQNSILNEVLTEVKEVKEMGISEKSISYDMPIKKGIYDKLVKEYNEFQASPKGQAGSTELNLLKKEVWNSGESKKIISSLVASDADLITAYKMGEALYAKGFKTSPEKNTKTAIKLIGYLNSKNKKLHEISAGEFADLIRDGIPGFEISYIKDGTTIVQKLPSSKLYNAGGVASMSQIVQSLRSLDFISGVKEKLLISMVEGFNKTLNESRGKGIKPAKTGVRKELLKRADKLSQNKNDEG
jgi:hypothetical protein